MSHIKLHHNPKTNLKAKANPNPKLQKSEKKNFEKKFQKKFYREPGVEAATRGVQCEHRISPLSHQGS